MKNISKYLIITTLVIIASVMVKSEYKASTYAYNEDGAGQWILDNIDSYLPSSEELADIPDGLNDIVLDKYYVLFRNNATPELWYLWVSEEPLRLNFLPDIEMYGALSSYAIELIGNSGLYTYYQGYDDGWEETENYGEFAEYTPIFPFTMYYDSSYMWGFYASDFWTLYQTNSDLGVTIDGTFFPIYGASEPDVPDETTSNYRPMDGDSYFSHFISVNGEWVNQWQITEGDTGTTSVMISGADQIGDNSLFYLNYIPTSGDYPKGSTWNTINYTIALDMDIPDYLSNRVDLSAYNLLSARYLNKYTGEYEYLGIGDVIYTNVANQITFSFACNLDEVEVLEFFITGDYLKFCHLGTLNSALYNTIDYTYTFDNATGTYVYGFVDSGIDLSPSFENPDLSLLPDLVIPDFSAIGLGQVLTTLCNIDVVRLMLITCVVMGVLSYVVFGKRG